MSDEKVKMERQETIPMGEHFQILQSMDEWQSVVKLFDILKKRWLNSLAKLKYPDPLSIGVDTIKKVSQIAAIEDFFKNMAECIDDFQEAEEERRKLLEKQLKRRSEHAR